MSVHDKPSEIKLSLESALNGIYDIGTNFTLELLRFSENYTFCLTQAGTGLKRIVRVSLPGYHDDEELSGELMWMKELSEDTELNLPEVFTGKNCSLIQKFPCESSGKIYRCCMFSFLEGTALKDLSGKELFSQLEKTGAILAKLHIQSQTRDISRPLKRFSWDIDDLLGKDARWGNWRGNEILNKKQTCIL